MTEENIYIKQRLEKVEKLRSEGVNPYPNGILPGALCRNLNDTYHDWDAARLESLSQSFSLAGRVMFRRSFGKAGFIKIRDRSGELQIFCQKDSLSPKEFEWYQNLDLGDFVFVEGTLFRTKTHELTLKAATIRMVTKSLRNLPEKWHGLTDVETRYRQRYVDLIANPTVRETFVKRSQIIQFLRNFLVTRDFLEVETPMMHSIPGGAAARPFVTHHNKLDMDLYLRIAPELYLKRLVVGGLERVFEVNRNFRNEGISIQHNPEFTMLEFYQSYATFEDLMRLTEDMLGELAQTVCGTTEVAYQGQTIQWKAPFQKLTIREALVSLGGIDLSKVDDISFLKEKCQKLKLLAPKQVGGAGLYQTLLFETLCESKLIQPTFITQFPIEVSPLSRRNDADSEFADRFELYIFGREIANAFSELNDPVDQKERFLHQVASKESGNDEAMHYDADYIRALEYGMPPTAGEGIGIDRLVMLLTDSPSIRDVILFPQLKSEQFFNNVVS